MAWWYLCIGAFVVFEVVRTYADNIGFEKRGDGLERGLFGGLPSLYLQEHTYHVWPRLTEITSDVIHTSWFIVPWLVALAVSWRRPERIASFFRWWMALLAVSGLVMVLVPMRPPWMVDGEVVRIIALRFGGDVPDPNPYAAMPSLHVALPLVATFWFAREGWRWPAIAMGVYSGLIALEVVVAGEHYVVDAAGSVLAASAVVAGSRLYHTCKERVAMTHAPWRARRRPTSAAPRAAESGQSLIEFALMFPIVLVFLAAIVIFGLAMYARASMQQGVREGARQFAVGKTVAEVQTLTAGNASEWVEESEVEVCLPAGSSGNVGDAVTVQLRDKDDMNDGIAFELVPVSGIFNLFGVTPLTVRLDPKGTARLEKSVPPGTVAAC